MIPGVKCSNKHSQKIYDSIESFVNDGNVKSKLRTPGNMAALKFEQIFHRPLKEFDIINYSTLGMSRVNRFKSELKWVARKIRNENTTSMFGKWAYTTQARNRYNPIGSELHGKFIESNHYYKARNVRNSKSFEGILSNLKDYAVSQGYMKNEPIKGKVGRSTWDKMAKKATKLENDIVRAQVELAKGDIGAKDRLLEATKKQEEYLMSNEGRVFKEFADIVEGSKEKTGRMGLKDLAQEVVERYADEKLLEKTAEGKVKKALIDKMNNHMDKLTNNPFLKEALKEYIVLMRQNHHSLTRGVDAYLDGIKLGLKSAGRSPDDIKTIEKKLKELITPSEEIGYYPHYRYDLNSTFYDNLMPKLEALNVVTRESFIRDQQGIDNALSEINKYLDQSSYLLQRAKHRKKDDTAKYSLNFPVVMKRYTDEVSRFNFMAYSNKYAREAIDNVKTMWHKGVELDGYGKDVINEILDLHEAQTGSREMKHPEFNALQRTLLNLEFVSKIGLNPRSAVRNLSQTLLNVVQWTPRQIFKMKRWYKKEIGIEFENTIEQMFDEVGLKYEDPVMLMEAGERVDSAMGAKVNISKDLSLTFRKPGPFTAAAKFTGKLGAFAGKMHSKVENYNRKLTFKMAFYEAYKGFKFDKSFNEFFRKELAKKKNWDESSVTDNMVHNEIMKRAKNYAIRMTTLLHFDYADISKNKLMKTQIGRMMLQFQHYGFEFFNYNLDVAKDAYHGRLNPKDPATWRAMSMMMVYGLAPLMMGMMAGNEDWFGLIQHNTAERANQIYQIFTGDEEEVREAFYGKPPALAFFGGPFFNDILTVGQMYRWWDLSDNELFRGAQDWQKLAELEDDDKLRELTGIMAPQFQRWRTQTLPILNSSGFFPAVKFELGLYPSSDIKQLKEDLGESLKDVPVIGYAMEKFQDLDEWNSQYVKETKQYYANKYGNKVSNLEARLMAAKDYHSKARKRNAQFRIKKRKRFKTTP